MARRTDGRGVQVFGQLGDAAPDVGRLGPVGSGLKPGARGIHSGSQCPRIFGLREGVKKCNSLIVKR